MDIKTIPESVYLDYWISQMEKKMSWTPVGTWRSRDFERLGELIFSHTGVRISITSLKRFFGRANYDGNVGVVFLDALAVFLGYANWMDFKIRNQLDVEMYYQERIRGQRGGLLSDELSGGRRSFFLNETYFAIVLLSLLIVVGGIFVVFRSKRSNPHENVFEFYAENPKGVIPYNVRFRMNLSGVQADSFFLVAGDKNTRMELHASDSFISRFYFIPGLRKAKLIANEEVLGELELFAYTEGWTASVERGNKTRPIYVHADSIISENRLYLSPEKLARRQVLLNEPYTTNYYNIRHFNVDGDNCAFAVRVKNSLAEGGDACQHTNVGLLCEHGFVSIPLINEGCLSLAKVFYGDVLIKGSRSDLSPFAVDMNEWNELYVKVEDKKVTFFINDVRAFQLVYNSSLGEVLGFRIKYFGTGSLDQVRLFDHNHHVVYEENFGGLAR